MRQSLRLDAAEVGTTLSASESVRARIVKLSKSGGIPPRLIRCRDRAVTTETAMTRVDIEVIDDPDDCEEVNNISRSMTCLGGMRPEQAREAARDLHQKFLAMMEEKTPEERRRIRREMWQAGVDAGYTDAREEYEEFEELEDGERRHLCGCPFTEQDAAAPGDETQDSEEDDAPTPPKPRDIPPDRGRLH
jgi:hypothetical protein